jgi:hypothetical protein
MNGKLQKGLIVLLMTCCASSAPAWQNPVSLKYRMVQGGKELGQMHYEISSNMINTRITMNIASIIKFHLFMDTFLMTNQCCVSEHLETLLGKKKTLTSYVFNDNGVWARKNNAPKAIHVGKPVRVESFPSFIGKYLNGNLSYNTIYDVFTGKKPDEFLFYQMSDTKVVLKDLQGRFLFYSTFTNVNGFSCPLKVDILAAKIYGYNLANVKLFLTEAKHDITVLSNQYSGKTNLVPVGNAK